MNSKPVSRSMVKAVSRRNSTSGWKYSRNSSLSSFLNAMTPKATVRPRLPIAIAQRRRSIQPARRPAQADADPVPVAAAGASVAAGSRPTSMSAGSSVCASIHAAVTPMATMLPMSRNGGDSLVLRLRKPSTVVNDVKNTDVTLLYRLSSIAARRSSPRWRFTRYVLSR